MARITGNVTNTAILNDNLGGGQIHLYYRHPTTEERAAYTNMSLQRLGDQLVVKKGEARLEYGQKILTGFRFGDFLRPVTPAGGGESELKPFSHDPTHPDYAKNWQELVMDGGADLVELLTARVFDAACSFVTPTPAKKPASSGQGDQKNTAPEESAAKN